MRARILTLAAPAGYGKRTVLHDFAARVGPLVVCELPPDADAAALARAVVDSLVERHGSRAARSAADRLAQRRERLTDTIRDILRREWVLDTGPEVFDLYDPANVLASSAGADLLDELVRTLPPQRRLSVTARYALPPTLERIVERESVSAVTADRLALSRAETIALARRAGLSRADADELHVLARGWPLVSRLLAPLATTSRGVLDDAAAVPHETLLSFAAHRVFAASSPQVRDALVVTMLLRGAQHSDLTRILGEDCDDAVFARLIGLAFVSRSEGRAVVHPEVGRLLRSRFDSVVKRAYRRVLEALTGDGAYVEAARVALDAGDVEHAAAIIDAAPPYTAASVPLAAYERVIDRIDPALVTRYPNMWIATRPFRAFAVDRTTYLREAETVYYCLPAAAGDDQRAAVAMHLISAYVNVGRAADADALIADVLDGFAAAPSTARAAVLNLTASLRGIDGRFSEARALAQQAASISRDAFGENQTLHYIDLHEAVYRGRHDRFLVIMDELLRRRSREELPLYAAYAAGNGAIFSWVAGDDDAFRRYLAVAEEAVTPGIAAGFGPILDAARGRDVRLDPGHAWPLICALVELFRMSTAQDDRSAVESARSAARYADERGDPFIQILAHAAVAVLDPERRDAERSVLEALVAPVESPELADAVHGLVAGNGAGMLDAFVERRVRRRRVRSDPSIEVDLIAGRIRRAGEVVRLSDKQFELVAFVASTYHGVSRERIGEALWEHLDPEEWRNNFKVTMHRVRGALGVAEFLVGDQGHYRLAPWVRVDLRDAESLLREHAEPPLAESARARLDAILATFREGTAGRYERFAWSHTLTARINDVICAAGTTLAADALARGDHEDALRYSKEVTAADPYNERACETAVRVLLRRGDLDGARREFRRYANALSEGLAAAPSPAIAELVRNA